MFLHPWVYQYHHVAIYHSTKPITIMNKTVHKYNIHICITHKLSTLLTLSVKRRNNTIKVFHYSWSPVCSYYYMYMYNVLLINKCTRTCTCTCTMYFSLTIHNHYVIMLSKKNRNRYCDFHLTWIILNFLLLNL